MRGIVRSLIIAAAVAGVVWIDSARRRAQDVGSTIRQVIGCDLRAFVTHRFNPLVMRLGLAGGRRSVWAIIEHVGRRSGTVYRTPVLPRCHGDEVFIPLPYGDDVDWVKNVRAAGHTRLQWHETLYELDEPAVLDASENPMLAPRVTAALDRLDRRYLRLHILEHVPATFSHVSADVESAWYAEPVLPVPVAGREEAEVPIRR
jgi:deazaflavin-dependent oxidoreductase (nitroreductase family)